MPSLRFQDFSGGLWVPAEQGSSNEQPGFAVPANALLQADNVEYLPSGGIRGRRGRTLRTGAPIANADSVIGLWRHYGRRGQLQATKSEFSVFEVGTFGTAIWADVAQAESEDGLGASVNLIGGVSSHYLKADHAHFVIPTTSAVVGIEVAVKRCQQDSGSVGAVRDIEVRLSKAGHVPVGDNKALVNNNWPVAEYQWEIYGGPSDLWGTTWTPDEINAVDFGAMLAVTSTHAAEVAQVDCFRITIYYTVSDDLRRFLVATHETYPFLQSVSVFQEHQTIPGSFWRVGGWVDTGFRPRFVYWPARNMTFVFAGGTDLYQYNGSSMERVLPAVISDVTMQPRTGPHAALFKDRLYATDPNELNYSVYASDILDETIWRPDAHLNVSDSQGGRINGLEAWGDSLWIFKETSIWRWVGDVSLEAGISPLTQVSERGCVAPATIQVTPWGMVYLAADGLFVMTTEGEQDLSAPIAPLFASRTTKTVYASAVGVYHERRDVYYLKLDPTASECYVLHRVKMPTTEGEAISFAWSRIPLLPLNAGCTWPGEQDAGELFLGDLDGYIWEADVGASDTFVPIATTIQTPFRTLSSDRVRGRAYEVEAVYRGTGSLSGDLRYDQATAAQVALSLGTATVVPAFQYPRQTIVDQAYLGRFVAMALTNAIDGPEYELHEISLSTHLRSKR